MKTILDSNGLMTLPYGGVGFEVSVPMTVQGVDLVYEIQCLTKTIGILTERLLQLEQGQAPTVTAAPSNQPVAKIIKTPAPEPVEAPVEPVEVPVEQSTVTVEPKPEEAVEAPVVLPSKKTKKP